MQRSSAAKKLRLGESAHRKLRCTLAIVCITTSLAVELVHPFQEGTQPAYKDIQYKADFTKLVLFQSHSDASFDYTIRGSLFAIPTSMLLLAAATTKSIAGI
jgi:hypothetical protein